MKNGTLNEGQVVILGNDMPINEERPGRRTFRKDIIIVSYVVSYPHVKSITRTEVSDRYVNRYLVCRFF